MKATTQPPGHAGRVGRRRSEAGRSATGFEERLTGAANPSRARRSEQHLKLRTELACMLAQTWLAEAAAHRHGLKEALLHSQRTAKTAVVHIDATDGSEDVGEAIRATQADTDEDVRDMEEDEAMTRRALDLLSSRDNDPYEVALETLREDTRGWWAETLARGPDEVDER
jgi:hypothetical protein